MAWYLKEAIQKKTNFKTLRVIQHLRKMISIFYKKKPKKLIAISPTIDCASIMIKLILKPRAISPS